jgi:glyoxylase-like metal-dependent hydrolase (beta-lactamase superfamily II)
MRVAGPCSAPGPLTMEALRVLRARNPSPMTLDGTRTFVVGRDRPALIDPGPADPDHLARIREALGGRIPVAILLTHHHPDHAAAAPQLAAESGAPVLMARGAIDIGFPAVAADRWLEPDDVFQTGAGSLRAVATPGHAPEHTAFFWSGAGAPEAGALFVGDLVMGTGETSLVATPEGDIEAYLRSLDVVRELGAGVLFPTHGPPLDDPRDAVDRYVRHRLERIAQVLEALRAAGPSGPEALVEPVYGDALDPRLAAAAAASIDAILRYLVARGDARAESPSRYAASRPNRSDPR